MKFLKNRKITIVILNVFFPAILSLTSWGQDYNIGNVSGELLDNAKAVVRNHTVVFEIEKPGKAVWTEKIAISILKEKGDALKYFAQPYNKYSKIKSIRGKIYDGKGKKIKKVKKEDLYDFSFIPGFNFYDDTRIILHDPKIKSYPFTVEYEFEIHYNGMFIYPDLHPYPDYNVGVQNAQYTVVLPKELSFNYKAVNSPVKPEKERQDDNFKYTWKFGDLEPVLTEDYSMPTDKAIPFIRLAPREFEIEDYEGTLESWKDLNNFIFKLNKDRRELDEERVNEIIDLTRSAESDLEIVEILYNYLQKKTRYVSIQIGIGGWQPMHAKDVDEMGYGDCKALVNYMQTLLEAAEIDSKYVLIKAGRNASKLDTTFPSSQFNHAILMVPLPEDTVWLECTSQVLPCGYLGTFTDNRYALSISEEGGAIVKTPELTEKDNTLIRKAEVLIQNDGIGKCSLNYFYSGMFYDEVYPILEKDREDRKRRILNTLSIPDFELNEFMYSQTKTAHPTIKEEINLDIKNYVILMQDRIFLPLDLLGEHLEVPKKTFSRTNDLYIRRSSRRIDSICFTLPKGLEIEVLPENQHLITESGTCELKTHRLSPSTVLFVKKTILKAGTYPAHLYDDFREFCMNTQSAANMKAVFKAISTIPAPR